MQPVPRAEISYLLCALPRSGSSAVGECLSATGLAGNPREYFHPEAGPKWRQALGLPPETPARAYLETLRHAKASPNGVFGAKIMRSQFGGWLEQLEPAGSASAPVLLAGLLPGLRYVWMRRQDLVRQAVSLVRAAQTGRWNTRNPDRPARAEPHFDFDEIEAGVRLLQREDREWAEFFAANALEPIRLDYEEFDRDQAGCIRAVLSALGIDAPAEGEIFRRPLTRARQSDALNAEWAARYRESL